ncbi:unnamed protein product [Cochlearia groenlandica]
MAENETQDPFNLTFQEKSIHSGSISFGRFEKDGLLSWERRSSFSHNKYLEEADKCSKPGSVTLIKARLEAHFKSKNKGILFPASLDSQYFGGVSQKTVKQDHDDDIVDDDDDDDDDDVEDVYVAENIDDYRCNESFSESMSESNSPCYQSHEQVKCDQESDDCVNYDEIVVNSDDVIELDEEGGVENRTISVSLDNVAVSLERVSIEEDSSKEDHGLTEIKEDYIAMGSRFGTHTPKQHVENVSSGMSVAKVSTKRHEVTSKDVTRRRNVDAKSRKEIKPKKTVESQPPKSKKAETRTPLVTNRSKIGTKVEMSTNAPSFSLKCSERAEKRKEYYMKLEEKIHAKKTETSNVHAKTQENAEAEMKQFRKSLNFKAKPMPSFYNTRTRPDSQNKTEPSKFAPSRPRHAAESASITNKANARVGYKHRVGEDKIAKAMISSRKQSVAKDLGLRKGNVTAVKT